MEHLIELVIYNERSLQIVEIEELDPNEAYVAVPFGFRSLPLIVAAIARGERVVCEDAWENSHMHHYASRPEDYPENVATAQLFSVTIRTRDNPAGITKLFSGAGLDRLPQLHEWNDGRRWESVLGIEVTYKIRYADGKCRAETYHPDYFIFEDNRGEYNVFHQAEHHIETQAIVISGCEAFIRPHTDFDDFNHSDIEERGENSLIAEIETRTALARGDVAEALRIAAGHVGVPGVFVDDLIGDR